MKTTRRWLILVVALALPMWVATAADAGKKPDCSVDSDHPSCKGEGEDPPPQEVESLNCAELGWASDYGGPVDGELLMEAGHGDCNDIPSKPNGTTITFTFAVNPTNQVIKTIWVLGIRNSVPGDWCRGTWSYYDKSHNLLFSGYGNAIRPNEVADGYTATLLLAEVDADGNCTTDGVVRFADDEPGWWVVDLGRSGGKPLKGDESITVTWDITPPPLTP